LIIVRQPTGEIKKGIISFRLKPGNFVTIKKFVVPAFHQNGNIKSPKVASLVKNFLIANSTKYIQFLDKWIPVDFTLDCPPALLL
jgi:hypothetical protein